MLQYQTVDSTTLELLIRLQSVDAFKDLCLAGGTALALQIGHRMSVDLDLFGKLETSEAAFANALTTFEKVIILKKTANIHIFSINDIKVDFVNYPYPWIDDGITAQGIRLAGLRDIAAMKLAAITGRGTKKDFIDIFFLLQEFSLSDMLRFYEAKYRDGSSFLVLKSLVYFDDAEPEQEPFMLKAISWQAVKATITTRQHEYLQKL